jgi:hypothetical protein
LLQRAEQEKEGAILVPKLKVNGDIVTVPRKLLKENQSEPGKKSSF